MKRRVLVTVMLLVITLIAVPVFAAGAVEDSGALAAAALPQPGMEILLGLGLAGLAWQGRRARILRDRETDRL